MKKVAYLIINFSCWIHFTITLIIGSVVILSDPLSSDSFFCYSYLIIIQIIINFSKNTDLCAHWFHRLCGWWFPDSRNGSRLGTADGVLHDGLGRYGQSWYDAVPRLAGFSHGCPDACQRAAPCRGCR